MVRKHLRIVAGAAPAVHRQLNPLAKLARQVFHVHAGPAIDLRRVFAGEESG